MYTTNAKRFFSLLLAVLMVISMVPAPAYAEETHDHDHEHNHAEVEATQPNEGQWDGTVEDLNPDPTEEPTEAPADPAIEPEISAVYAVQIRVDNFLRTYLGSVNLTQTEIEEIVSRMDDATLQQAKSDLDALGVYAEEVLSEDEVWTLVKSNLTLVALSAALNKDATVSDLMATTTVATAGGNVEITSNVGSFSVSGTTVTFTNSVSGFQLGYSYSFTIKNASSVKATLTYTTTTETFDTKTTSVSGTVLEPGASVSLSASTQCWSGQSDKWVLSNVLLTPVPDTATVNVTYDSTQGTVTTADGVLASGMTATVSCATGVTATPASGYVFVGWVNASDNAVVSTNPILAPEKDANLTLKAIFAKDGGNGVYMVGNASSSEYKDGLLGTTATYYNVSGSYLFDDFTAAMNFASSSTNKYVVLMNNATLPAGNYTVPTGVTLLIPFDDANTLYTTTPCSIGTYTTPTAYRTLTLSDGANLVVNGALSLSAKHRYASGAAPYHCAPTGAVSFVQMQGSSNITVNNGGSLYAYGYITGSGSVTVNSGAKVYELFQITDFRGGTQSTNMDNGVFLISQYYVQNVEVPMTIHAGATEHSYTTIYMSSAAFGSSVAFIGGNGSMFNLSSGYVTKRYDGTTDRLMVEAYGDLTVSPINMGVGSTSINSADYDLGINGNITVEVHSGTITLAQDIALLPGAKIIINEGTTCILGDGINFYIYDADQWGNYCSSIDQKLVLIPYAPSKRFTRTIENMGDASIVINGGYVDVSKGYIYTTASGAAITGTEGAAVKMTPGTQNVTYQLLQVSATYVEIPITPAKLKNADGTYMETAVYGAGTYEYSNGVWHIPACQGLYTTTVTKEPTCTEAGSKTTACGCVDAEGNALYAPKVEEIPALGHDLTTTPGKAATCTEDGLTDGATCSRCDHEVIQTVIPALGHADGELIVDNEANCTVAGDGHYVCERCGRVSESVEIPATGHNAGNPVTENEKKVTCEADGSYDTVVYCTACSAELSRETTTVTAPGHNYETVPGKAPTCTETGLTDGEQCTVCQNWKTEQTVIPATGHTPVVDEAVESTCTATGLTEGSHCSVCGYVIKAQTETLKKEHTRGEAREENHKAPTCTEEGSYDTVVRCTVCNEVLASATNTIPATGHTSGEAVIENEVAATCTTDGSYDTVVYCTACSEELSRVTTTVVAKGHIPGAPAEENRVEATCQAAGSYDTVVKCDVCDEELSRNTTVLAQLAHTEVIIPAVEATCTSTGLKAGKKCSVCGTVTLAQEEIPMAEHMPANAAKENEVAPTCTEVGGYDMVVRCKDCETELSSKHTEIPALGHDYESVVTAPTCTEGGYTTYTCSRCGDNYVADEQEALGHDWSGWEVTEEAKCEVAGEEKRVCSRCGVEETQEIPALEHDYESVVTAPTCTEGGYTTYTCSRCGNSYVADQQEALGHDYESVVTAPTCTEGGYTTYTCSRCGSSYVADQQEALGHDYESVVTAPTCTDKGYTTHTCERCGDVVVDSYVDPVAHSYTAQVTTKPDCVSTGVETYTCSGCGDSYTKTLAALGHSSEVVVGKAPTCTETGLTDGEKCSVCGRILKKQETIPMVPHSEGEAVTENKVDPDCTNDGSYDTVVYCAVCGAELSRVTTVVDALGHTPGEAVVENTVAPTCTVAGSYDAVVYCSVCNTEISRTATEIPAVGHTPGEAATCTTAQICTVCNEELAGALGHNYVSEVTLE